MTGISINGYTRVQMRTAKKTYLRGAEVFLLPCKVNPCNPWIAPVGIKKETEATEEEAKKTWEQSINAYAFYNLCSETGKYISFYLK